jgi:hypothetical protein
LLIGPKGLLQEAWTIGLPAKATEPGGAYYDVPDQIRTTRNPILIGIKLISQAQDGLSRNRFQQATSEYWEACSRRGQDEGGEWFGWVLDREV